MGGRSQIQDPIKDFIRKTLSLDPNANVFGSVHRVGQRGKEVYLLIHFVNIIITPYYWYGVIQTSLAIELLYIYILRVWMYMNGSLITRIVCSEYKSLPMFSLITGLDLSPRRSIWQLLVERRDSVLNTSLWLLLLEIKEKTSRFMIDHYLWPRRPRAVIGRTSEG